MFRFFAYCCLVLFISIVLGLLAIYYNVPWDIFDFWGKPTHFFSIWAIVGYAVIQFFGILSLYYQVLEFSILDDALYLKFRLNRIKRLPWADIIELNYLKMGESRSVSINMKDKSGNDLDVDESQFIRIQRAYEQKTQRSIIDLRTKFRRAGRPPNINNQGTQ